MKIFDCFMYFDEEIVLDLRLNTLDEFVDYFVIVESSFNHKGEKRELKFNLNLVILNGSLDLSSNILISFCDTNGLFEFSSHFSLS